MANFILSAFADEAADDLSEQIRIMGNNAIKYIEMRSVNGKSLVDCSINEVKEIKKSLEEKGFKLSAVGSPFGKIGIKDDFKPHLEHFKRGIEIANILEAKYIRVFSFYIGKGNNPDDFQNEVVDRLGCFIENSNGIICAHENEKGIYGENAERCKTLYDSFNGKLKLIFDPANFIQSDVDTLAAWELLKDYTAYMHIKDALIENGAVVPAGYGDGKIEEILHRLSESEGEYFLSVEPHLKVFKGFDSLERENVELKGIKQYKSSEEAFNTAALALKSILCAIGFTQSKDIGKGYGIWTR